MRLALRSLRRTPWYSAALTGAIALGIALASAVFSIVDGALFKPLPYRDADRVFAIAPGHAALGEAPSLRRVSPVDLLAWRTALPEATFAALGQPGWATVGPNYDVVQSLGVEASFFDTLGAAPATGGFSRADFDAYENVRPAIVTHAFFMERLGGDATAVGRTLAGEGGTGTRVVGVLPEGFVIPDVFMPEVLTPQILNLESRSRSLHVLVRLPDDVSIDEATARMVAASARVADAWPTSDRPAVNERSRITRGPFDLVTLMPVRDAWTNHYRLTAWIVFAAAVCLLALVCLNVTGLAAARVRERWAELAVRRSLGARYADLARLLAIENGILIVSGLTVGLLGAPLAVRVTDELMPSSLRMFKLPTVDVRVIVMAAGAAALCLAAVTFFSAHTAWRAGDGVRPALAESRVTRRNSWWLLSAQVAVGLVITVCGALAAGSLLRVWSVNQGLPRDDAALVRISPPPGTPAADIERFIAEVRAIPGVVQAGGAHRWILQQSMNGSVFDRPEGVDYNLSESIPITTGYLETAGLEPIAGRLPTLDELAGGAPVIVVSEIVSRKFWPGEPAVGQSLTHRERAFEVVGVVPDVRYIGLEQESRGAIYWPVSAEEQPGLFNVLLRLDQRTTTLTSVVDQMTARCPTCWLEEAEMLVDAMAGTIRPRRFRAWLFTSFGAAALLIIGTGVLGLVAMTTALRTREIGIRLALGSTPGRVVTSTLRQPLGALVAGLAVGGGVAAWITRFLESYLYETSVYDSGAWLAAAGSLTVVTLIAGAVPAIRASVIDPVRVLRDS